MEEDETKVEEQESKEQEPEEVEEPKQDLRQRRTPRLAGALSLLSLGLAAGIEGPASFLDFNCDRSRVSKKRKEENRERNRTAQKKARRRKR